MHTTIEPGSLYFGTPVVLNLPSADLVAMVDRLALTTGPARPAVHDRGAYPTCACRSVHPDG